MPLSDPGPRLLSSTLALHRASHLLSARNLQPEPLPHPLPPSLHPPAPVDLAEFDIDFILAGSLTHLGGDKKSTSVPVDVLRRKDGSSMPATPTIKIVSGGDDEDTFAKFVGEFDDEYGDRRGEWTFRACPSFAQRSSTESITSEWESAGAGSYQLFANGEIRSTQQGRIWRVRRVSKREYELEEMNRGHAGPTQVDAPRQVPTKSTIIASSDCYILACKASHCEHGGVKLAVPAQEKLVAQNSGSSGAPPSTPQLRVSISDSAGTDRTARLGSQESTATGIAVFSQSLPLGSVLSTYKKGQPPKREGRDSSYELGRASISFDTTRNAEKAEAKKQAKAVKAQNKELDTDDRKKDRSIGSVFKRGFMAPFISTVAGHENKKAMREERERERLQSQSWSPSGLTRDRGQYHSTGKTHIAPRVPGRSLSSVGASKGSQSSSVGSAEKVKAPWLAGHPNQIRRLSTTLDRDVLEESTWREGKAWQIVPDEAVAMVVPIENDESRTAHDRLPHRSPFFVDGTRQALLVWYVPFNSESDERPTTSLTSASSSRPGSDSSSNRFVADSSSSLPKFQKLLRRHQSKDKEAMKRTKVDVPRQGESEQPPPQALSCFLHPLPFRSFRVVARVVDVDDLVSEPDVPATSFEQWQEQQHRPTKGAALASSFSKSPKRPEPSILPSFGDADIASGSTAPTSTIMAGRTFPTVIAVCHSRSQGVEFVLEGLDRLGFCKGESAWGPTGYEEWRGSGLSDKGRELLDLLWAGCTGVMGLTGQ